MPRVLSILLSCLLIAASMLAEDSLPIVEMKADRTMIYPQRMALEGEESLLDVLQMMPELPQPVHHASSGAFFTFMWKN